MRREIAADRRPDSFVDRRGLDVSDADHEVPAAGSAGVVVDDHRAGVSEPPLGAWLDPCPAGGRFTPEQIGVPGDGQGVARRRSGRWSC